MGSSASSFDEELQQAALVEAELAVDARKAGWVSSVSPGLWLKERKLVEVFGCERGAKSCCKQLIEKLVEMKLSFKCAGKRGGIKNLRWSVLEHAREIE